MERSCKVLVILTPIFKISLDSMIARRFCGINSFSSPLNSRLVKSQGLERKHTFKQCNVKESNITLVCNLYQRCVKPERAISGCELISNNEDIWNPMYLGDSDLVEHDSHSISNPIILSFVKSFAISLAFSKVSQ